jgi:hypothetical protein
MTFPETRSQLLSRGSWAGAGRLPGLLAALFLIAACEGSSPTASSTPSPSPSPSPSASPTASVAAGGEVSVPQQVLAPAPDLPVAELCSAQITTTADGNATPLLCHSGAVNVQAWKYYASISASIMGLGLNPTQGQAEAAVCDDFKHNHATKPEEASGYKLAATYYGWTFSLDPTKLTCP